MYKSKLTFEDTLILPLGLGSTYNIKSRGQKITAAENLQGALTAFYKSLKLNNFTMDDFGWEVNGGGVVFGYIQ